MGGGTKQPTRQGAVTPFVTRAVEKQAAKRRNFDCGSREPFVLAMPPLLSVSSMVSFLGAVTVVVVLASGDPSDPTTVALDRALRSALPEDARVSIQREEPAPGTWVAHVAWTDHDRRAILHTTDGRRESEREIRFDEADAPAERGRTVGFAVASMVPDELLAPRKEPPPPPPPSPAVVVPRPREAPVERPQRDPRIDAELLGQGATGIGGTAGGLGGALGARLRLTQGLHVRASVALRLGEVPSAQATSRVIVPSLGVGWLTAVGESFWVGGRVDALLLHQYVAHFSSDDPEPDGRGRLLPGVGGRVEGVFRIAERTGVMLALGPEIAFGTTKLYVVGVEADRIPPARICGEVGVTVAF